MDFSVITLKRPLALGAKGPDVKILQQALNDADEYNIWKPLVIDGHFGKATHWRVRAVQFGANLKEDGVVGKKTAEELGLTMGSGSEGTPITIRFEEPPRPPTTPPLQLLIDVIADGLRPLRDEIEDAILRAPSNNARVSLLRRDYANESYDDLIQDLTSWAKDLPQGNLAIGQLRTAFETYIQWMHRELEAAQFVVYGGWIWRYHPVLDKIPVSQIVAIAENVLRGQQSPVVAIAQLKMTFDQFNQMLDQVPHYDANGVGPEGKASVT